MKGNRIAQRRKQLNISQEELGYLIGVSQNQISKYEDGKNSPSARRLEMLADVLLTSTDWLLGRTDIVDRPLRGEGDLTEEERKLVQIFRSKDSNDRIKLLKMAELV